jgi:hypothetical protein
VADHHELTLTVVPDGARQEETDDFTREVSEALNAERGLNANLATREGPAGAKGVDPQLGKVLIEILTDPKVVVAFVSLLGTFLRQRPQFHFEIERNNKKLRIKASDFNKEQVQQMSKLVQQFLEK